MEQQISFYIRRLKERLWVKPLFSCALSILAIFFARLGDTYFSDAAVMDISVDTLKTLFSIISASMLGMAVFAVGSMLSAYSSVSTSATPHAFDIVITDDVSQYALSIFVGAFIFSVIGIIALMNGLYGDTGRFVIFILTLLVFAIVILGFVRWVDNIARLGTLGKTISKVEAVTEKALSRHYELIAGTLDFDDVEGKTSEIYSSDIGYLQQINIDRLQATATEFNFKIKVNQAVGSLILPNTPIAFIKTDDGKELDGDVEAKKNVKAKILKDFIIGKCRTFDEDPRFGFLVLSEIASRALSPAVNDPGTAIDIISVQCRLITQWLAGDRSNDDKVNGSDINSSEVKSPEAKNQRSFNRVSLPQLSSEEIFQDAFNGIARDGAANIEVMLRLQKIYQSLAETNEELAEYCDVHSKKALAYAKKELVLEEDYELLKDSYLSKEG
ncbi:DUF2254 domain-containing protein [Psychrosphaera haliotis]|uniref:DUF2254 domain-containing protein n=1 Tax=Psychrosphaera haliotis TaxID=555083 RepID=UPI0031D8A9F3